MFGNEVKYIRIIIVIKKSYSYEKKLTCSKYYIKNNDVDKIIKIL